jgi:hypothetical protein
MADFTPYSTARSIASISGPSWYPVEERDRVASYLKYDELYWNDETQFALRVLEGESPIYIPNARTIVDTTSHYLLKGLQVKSEDGEKYPATNVALTDFLKREMFYSRFHTAKHAGVARGDFAFHLTADPTKEAGLRLCLTSLDPSDVVPVYDDDDIEKVIRVHLIQIWMDPVSQDQLIKKLTYQEELVGSQKRISRVEGIYKLNEKWYGQKPDLVKITIPLGLLPPSITTIPVYWFKNIDWEGQKFGSSELRGFEGLLRGVSQAGTDQSAALSLEGLGVYATDGGRPVDESGTETDWEVAPGKVMEVPTGSYFRRVEGLGSLKPSMDHINYLESKLREAGGLSDVALGRVDVQTAQSGIALAIKFMPTLAKIEERDQAGVEKLQQLFFDWKTWMSAYEGQTLNGDIVAVIGQKLPDDRTATLNELNNMLDRQVISTQYYRAKMTELGWVFPDDIQTQIDDEAQKAAEQAAAAAPPGLQQNAVDAATGAKPTPPNQNPPGSSANRSNNKNRPNESAGTEAGQTPQRQARGGTSR